MGAHFKSDSYIMLKQACEYVQVYYRSMYVVHASILRYRIWINILFELRRMSVIFFCLLRYCTVRMVSTKRVCSTRSSLALNPRGLMGRQPCAKIRTPAKPSCWKRCDTLLPWYLWFVRETYCAWDVINYYLMGSEYQQNLLVEKGLTLGCQSYEFVSNSTALLLHEITELLHVGIWT